MPGTGDAAAIGEAASIFLERILADPMLRPHWAVLDEARVRRSARAFVIQGIGGPDLELGDIGSRRALGLDDAAYDRLEELLAASLRDAGVSEAMVELAVRRVEELRAHLVLS
jgi:truncated hemoglobin YjbI